MADDQHVAFAARRLEQRQVPGVEQVEAAVGEHDAAAGGAPAAALATSSASAGRSGRACVGHRFEHTPGVGRLAQLQLSAPRAAGRARRRPERPAVERAVDADVLDAALDPERVQPAVVVVGRAVALVRGDVEQVGALDQAQVLDREAHLGLAREAARDVVLEVGVGAVDADAVRREQADAEDEVLDRLLRGDRAARPSASRPGRRRGARARARPAGARRGSRPRGRPSVRPGSRPAEPGASSAGALCRGLGAGARAQAVPPRRPRRTSGTRRPRASARRGPRVLPWLSHSTSSHIFSTRPRLWVTNRMVLPRRRNSAILSRHLRVKASSPTASTSSIKQHVGIDVDGDREAEPHVHARGVGLDRRVDEVGELGELHDLVEAPLRSACA